MAHFYFYFMGKGVVKMSTVFGDHLRELRKNNTNYNQEKIAELLDISRSTYTYYETGKTEPSQETLLKLCNILNVDFNTLLGVQSDSDTAVASDSVNLFKNLSPDEEMLILAYRNASSEGKKSMLKQASNMVKGKK